MKLKNAAQDIFLMLIDDLSLLLDLPKEKNPGLDSLMQIGLIFNKCIEACQSGKIGHNIFVAAIGLRTLLENTLNVLIIIESCQKEFIIENLDAYRQFQLYYAYKFAQYMNNEGKLLELTPIKDFFEEVYAVDIVNSKPKIQYRWQLLDGKKGKGIKQMLLEFQIQSKEYDIYEHMSLVGHPNYLSTSDSLYSNIDDIVDTQILGNILLLIEKINNFSNEIEINRIDRIKKKYMQLIDTLS